MVDRDDELRPVTSLFADVVGSTSLGERLSAAEVKALIGECVSRMCEAIESFGGEVRSYMGDGVAGFFGIDRAREDDCERAVRAALEIRRVTDQYSVEVESAWGVKDFDVRIGLNFGRVAVGFVGAGDPQRVALGDPVNVAARLQSAAHPGSILVGGSLALAVCDRFVCRPVGRVAVKGRAVEVEAFELEAPGTRRRSTSRTRLVGRSKELGELEEAVRDVCHGRGQLVAVTGESGIGKSRLIVESRLHAPAEVIWLEASCDVMDEQLPHQPFADLLRCWLGIDARTPVIESRLRFKSIIGELLGDRFDEFAPYLSRLLGLELKTKLDSRLDGFPGDVLATGLQSALGTWLATLAERAPVVVAIDNLGVASESTLNLFGDLLPLIEDTPLLFLIAMRSSRDSAALALHASALAAYEPRVRTIRLTALDPNESALLVKGVASASRLDARLVDLVIERAEGNPLYIEELLSAVEGADPGELPRPLEAVLLARLDSLDPSTRRAVQAAGILGRTFIHGVLALMLGETPARLAISSLLRADLVRESSRAPRSYSFRHGLTRDAALSTLTPEALSDLHGLAAAALEHWSDFDPERDSVALANHLIESGRVADAQAHVSRLARRLMDVGRLSDGLRLLEDCVTRLSEGDTSNSLRLQLALAWSEQGRAHDAVQMLDTALECADRSERWGLTLARARCLYEAGRLEEAGASLSASELSSWPAVDRARCEVLNAEIALERGDLVAARTSIDRAGNIPDLPLQVSYESASIRAGVLAAEGNLNEAETCALEAQALADRVGNLDWKLSARRHVAMIALWKGCVHEAHHLNRIVYEQYRAAGLRKGWLYAGLMLLHTSHLLGELSAGARVGEELLGDSLEENWRVPLSVNCAVIRSEQGDFEAALELVDCVDGSTADLPAWVRVGALSVRATSATANGDYARAKRFLLRGIEETNLGEHGAERAFLMTSLAELSLVEDDIEEALCWSARAVELVGYREPWMRLAAERCRAEAVAAGDPDAALESLCVLAEQARGMGLVLEEGKTLMSRGVVDHAARDVYFERAREIFTAHGSRLGVLALDHLVGRLARRHAADCARA